MREEGAYCWPWGDVDIERMREGGIGEKSRAPRLKKEVLRRRGEANSLLHRRCFRSKKKKRRGRNKKPHLHREVK